MQTNVGGIWLFKMLWCDRREEDFLRKRKGWWPRAGMQEKLGGKAWGRVLILKQCSSLCRLRIEENNSPSNNHCSRSEVQQRKEGLDNKSQEQWGNVIPDAVLQGEASDPKERTKGRRKHLSSGRIQRNGQRKPLFSFFHRKGYYFQARNATGLLMNQR